MNDRDFCAQLAEQGVLVLPGHVVELPGYFRISLTAADEMVERSLPVFARIMERCLHRHEGHESTTHRAPGRDTPG